MRGSLREEPVTYDQWVNDVTFLLMSSDISIKILVPSFSSKPQGLIVRTKH